MNNDTCTSETGATIGERLLLIRKQLKLSQQEMAVLAGVSINSYAGYEHGDRLPTTMALFRLWKRHGILTSWVITGSGPRTTGTATDEPQQPTVTIDL